MPATEQRAKSYKIGEASITRVSEIMLEVAPPSTIFPEWIPELHSEAPPESLFQSIHTWVVRTPQHTLLIDTATGNDKERPFLPPLDHLKEPFLERLKAADVLPEQIDYVLLTHLHVDHVGWNTRLLQGKWIPTFRHAKYLMPLTEQEFFADPANREHPRYCVYEDSVLPVVQAGMAEFVGPQGGEVLEGVTYLPTTGHSLGHMSIALRSKGEEALFGGDVMHHPLQVRFPQLNSVYCEAAEQARRSRQFVLDYVAERRAAYFSTHFPESSAGHITREGASYVWRYL